MNDAIEALITRVLEREGGYVDHPNDYGKATNHGITKAALERWRGRSVSNEDVRALTQDEARAIYRAEYFRGLENVTDPKVLEFLFDYAVNSGPARAVKALMVVLGGEALASVEQKHLLLPLVCERYDFYLRIVGNDHSQAVFAVGWANRIDDWWRPAMASAGPVPVPLARSDADGILVKGERDPPGSTDGPIRRLQEKLVALGSNVGPDGPDGDFGDFTYRAVAAYQRSNGLGVDGVAGPQTLGALGLT